MSVKIKLIFFYLYYYIYEIPHLVPLSTEFCPREVMVIPKVFIYKCVVAMLQFILYLQCCEVV